MTAGSAARQENGRYVPVARAGIAQQAALDLTGNTLVVAEAVEFDCTNSACIGTASLYDLAQIP